MRRNRPSNSNSAPFQNIGMDATSSSGASNAKLQGSTIQRRRGILSILFPNQDKSMGRCCYIPYNKKEQQALLSSRAISKSRHLSKRKRRRQRLEQRHQQESDALFLDDEEQGLMETHKAGYVSTTAGAQSSSSSATDVNIQEFLEGTKILLIFAVADDFWTQPDSYSVKLFERLLQVVRQSSSAPTNYSTSETSNTHENDIKEPNEALKSGNYMVPGEMAVILLLSPALYEKQFPPPSIEVISEPKYSGMIPPWVKGQGVLLKSNDSFMIRTACGLPHHVPALAVLSLSSTTSLRDTNDNSSSHSITTTARLLSAKEGHEELALEWNSAQHCADAWLASQKSALSCSQVVMANLLFPSFSCGGMCNIL